MRSTVVPAQVTTVEDRIMGSLGFSQLALLVLPVFVAAGIFALFPPVMSGSIYKYLLSAVFALFMGFLAIRIKGKIILLWLITIGRYNLRPKYYLFNKNTAEFRANPPTHAKLDETNTEPVIKQRVTEIPKLALHDATKVLETIQKQNSNLRFELTKKGGLRVRFSQVKD